jgi:hypothetical protein
MEWKCIENVRWRDRSGGGCWIVGVEGLLPKGSCLVQLGCGLTLCLPRRVI